MILSATTHTVEIVTDTAASLHCVLGYTDWVQSTGTLTEDSQETTAAAATTTTVLSAPAASTKRTLLPSSIRNNDAASSVNVMVQKNANGTLLAGPTFLLAPKDTAQFDGRVWSVVDANGQKKIVTADDGSVGQLEEIAGFVEIMVEQNRQIQALLGVIVVQMSDLTGEMPDLDESDAFMPITGVAN